MRKIVFIFIFILGLSGCQGTKDQSTENKKFEPAISLDKEVKADANFLSIQGKVSHKRSKKLLWKTSKPQTPLYFKDWIKTQKLSEAKIQILKQGTIQLQPESVIVLLFIGAKEMV